MDKVKARVTRLDGTILEVEGSPDEVARILRELDQKQLAPVAVPYIIIMPAPEPQYPLTQPFPVGPIWAPAPTIAPTMPGWPLITCQTRPTPPNSNVC